jgi:NAD-dependent deacetylase
MQNKPHLVVLTGAGISAESGLKTFRDSDGLWNGYNIEDVATPRAWQKNPQLVLDFYNQRRHDVLAAKPNAAHLQLAQLEAHFEVTIITQNIDDLHERAGSSRVVHLHGEIVKCRSVHTDAKLYAYDRDLRFGDLAEDGGQLRPFIVWFEEPVPMIEKAAAICTDADIFVVIGTSLQVYPAAGLIDYAPPLCPKYIIDKAVPHTGGVKNITALQEAATTGVAKLSSRLLSLQAP